MSYKPGDTSICEMCGETIRYTGVSWDHLGDLQPRHPGKPKPKDMSHEVGRMLARFGVELGDKDEPVPDSLIEIVKQKAPEDWTKLERLTAATYYLAVKDDLQRLLGLVQSNQDFFGDPPAGESCIKLAADKLEQAIGLWRAGGHPVELEEGEEATGHEGGDMDLGTLSVGIVEKEEG